MWWQLRSPVRKQRAKGVGVPFVPTCGWAVERTQGNPEAFALLSNYIYFFISFQRRACVSVLNSEDRGWMNFGDCGWLCLAPVIIKYTDKFILTPAFNPRCFPPFLALKLAGCVLSNESTDTYKSHCSCHILTGKYNGIQSWLKDIILPLKYRLSGILSKKLYHLMSFICFHSVM